MDVFLKETINYFIYETLKILILLALIIFAVSIVRSFFPLKKVRELLSKNNQYLGHLLAAMLGIITPFCSCSAVPLFLGFVEAGVPLGVTFSFLVSSPMINEVALVLLLGMFGWKIALIYIASGFFIAIISGIIIGKLKAEHLVINFAPDQTKIHPNNDATMQWKDRMIYAKNYTLRILEKVWLYIVIGVGIGAWIHGYAPADFLAQYASADKWYAVPLATIIGIPLYSNAAGIIPLISALTEKGVAMGTALA
ncbi:MAG: permease, partial [Candidatus Peregrinibacteria bacterium]